MWYNKYTMEGGNTVKISRTDLPDEHSEAKKDAEVPKEEATRTKKHFGFRSFVNAFLITLIVVLTAYLIWSLYDFYHEPEFTSNEVIAELPEPTPSPIPGNATDVEPEEEKLPDYENQVAILTVDGVDITNEAVMQHPTEDEYYLYKDENGNYSIWGSYYVYHDWNMQSLDTLDKVTVIFGHSNGNSLYRKFSVLKHLKDADFARQHQYIYLTIDGVKSRWKIWAAADYPVANNYVQANPSDEFLQWEIDQMKAYSYNKYEVEVTPQDKILILSTCTGSDQYETRFIVCAVYDGIC